MDKWVLGNKTFGYCKFLPKFRVFMQQVKAQIWFLIRDSSFVFLQLRTLLHVVVYIMALKPESEQTVLPEACWKENVAK